MWDPVTCFYDKSCMRSFPSRNSFSFHFKSVHEKCSNDSSSYSNDSSTNSNDPIVSTGLKPGNETSIANISRDAVFAGISGVESVVSKTENHLMTDDEINEVIENKIEGFFSSLNSNPSIPFSHVQATTNSVNNLLKDVNNMYRQKIMNLCATLGKEDAFHIVSSMDGLFARVNSSLNSNKSNYLQLKKMEGKGSYIPPKVVILGRVLKRKRIKGIYRTVPVKECSVFIPLRKVLTKFLSQEGVLTDILNYIESLDKDELLLKNFVQGNVWRSTPHRSDGITLPLFVFNDCFECGNPLGGHAGINKVNSTYVSLPCLPPEKKSSLSSIFVALLVKSVNLKRFGKKAVFKPLIKELNFLIKKGIQVSVSENVTRRIFFQSSLLVGDNLGLNCLGGFTENFSRSNFCCRFCKSDKTERDFMVVENPELLRKVEDYEADVAIKNLKMTGIKERCVFNDVANFHVLKNMSVDIMHDIFEGIAKRDILFLLHHYVKVKRYLTLSELNVRINNFNFGAADMSNRPPCFTIVSLQDTKKTLKMSSSETICLVKYFGLLLGDLIPSNDPSWKLYKLLRKIVNIVMSPSLNIEFRHSLISLVQEHHFLYLALTKKSLTLKHHNLLHYPRLIHDFGPLIHFWTMRFESKHRILKSVANSVATRTNICLTIAKKIQVQFSHNLQSQKFSKNVLAYGRNEVEKNDQAFWANFNECFLTNSYRGVLHSPNTVRCSWIEINGTKYLEGTTLYVDVHEETSLPIFGLLRKVFISNDQDVYFLCKNFQTIGFCKHLCAFEIESVSSHSIYEQSKIQDHHPHTAIHVANSTYVSLLHNQ